MQGIDGSVKALIAEMFEIMRDEGGIGLAAPQAGRNLRIFVTEVHDDHPARAYLNPEFVSLVGGVVPEEEGCLSLPGVRVKIRRPPFATVRAMDENGAMFEASDAGMLARCWQHETDHLDGVLIIDRMGPMDRLATRKALRALERGEVPQ